VSSTTVLGINSQSKNNHVNSNEKGSKHGAFWTGLPTWPSIHALVNAIDIPLAFTGHHKHEFLNIAIKIKECVV
jgi:hypothetical protein